MTELIDTTEMYLKTIYELEEDGVTPLRARIVERLGHSGPTVSQTVGRMERDGLLYVMGDRRLELTDQGREVAVEVVRKHRLAERLLMDVIGLGWAEVHEEACRWEHVMSKQVEDRLVDLLGAPSTDPYGNPIPGSDVDKGTSVEFVARGEAEVRAVIVRIGEAIQADSAVIADFDALGLHPGAEVQLSAHQKVVRVVPVVDGELGGEYLALSDALTPHLFVKVLGD